MDFGEAQFGVARLLPKVADFEGSCPRQEPRLEAGATHRPEAGATQNVAPDRSPGWKPGPHTG